MKGALQDVPCEQVEGHPLKVCLLRACNALYQGKLATCFSEMMSQRTILLAEWLCRCHKNAFALLAA